MRVLDHMERQPKASPHEGEQDDAPPWRLRRRRRREADERNDLGSALALPQLFLKR